MAADPKELQIAMASPRQWTRRLTVTVPAHWVERERTEVLQQLSRRVRLPGFRKGKVPRHVIERTYGPEAANQALERVVREAYKAAVEQEQLRPITAGSIENVDYEAGSDLRFDVEFEVQPEIELNRLGGFRVRREQRQVGDEDVEALLERLRRERATWLPLEEAPSPGDKVRVEIAPLSDAEAEPAEAAEPRAYEFVLGGGQAVAEVEAAAQDLGIGEERELTLEAEAEGSRSRIRMRLLEALRAELPDLDDDFARIVGPFESVDELRQRVRQDLEADARLAAERDLRGRLLDQILEANPMELPASMVNEALERLLPAQADLTAEQLEAMRESARAATENALKRQLVIERVSELEGLGATEAEVTDRVRELAERHGRTEREVRTELQKAGRLGALVNELTEEKVFQYLLSAAVIE